MNKSEALAMFDGYVNSKIEDGRTEMVDCFNTIRELAEKANIYDNESDSTLSILDSFECFCDCTACNKCEFSDCGTKWQCFKKFIKDRYNI